MKKIREILPETIHNQYFKFKFWLMMKLCPEKYVGKAFRSFMGYSMNWKDPIDISEKINWMKVHYDQRIWARLADKYLVREYVKERIGEQYLTKLYGVWDRAEDIDFDALPNRFVLKTNQGCATVLIVEDKSKINIERTRKKLNEWVKMEYGRETVEPHYLLIKPKIIAEEYLENDATFSSSLVDYKVTTLNGKAYNIIVTSDRKIGTDVRVSVYDIAWNLLPDQPAGKHTGEAVKIPRPKCLNEMLLCAEKLALGHPQVRVDMYIINDKIKFGEMTFTSQGGYFNFLTRDYSIELGKKLILPKKTI